MTFSLLNPYWRFCFEFQPYLQHLLLMIPFVNVQHENLCKLLLITYNYSIKMYLFYYLQWNDVNLWSIHSMQVISNKLLSIMGGRALKRYILIGLLCVLTVGLIYQFTSPACFSSHNIQNQWITPEVRHILFQSQLLLQMYKVDSGLETCYYN